MTSKLIYICDICQKEMKLTSEGYLVEADIFGLEQGSDICSNCYDKISKAIYELKEESKYNM